MQAEGECVMVVARRIDEHDAEFARVMAEAMRTLTSDFEFLDLAHQLTISTTQLLGAGASGVMLEDGAGHLQVLSASDEDTRLLEVFELQREEGPCYECWRTGEVVTAPAMLSDDRWPVFVEEARALGFTSAVAVPLRLRSQVVGALNVFWTTPWVASPGDLDAAQALADVAAVGLVQQRLARETGVVAEQLETALHSRATIEQAKGVIAAKGHLSIPEAFRVLETYSFDQGKSIVSVAQRVVDRQLVWKDGGLRPR
jgi:transcriptional regulator with GAF, ATPase, and Fis domain